MKRRFLLLLLIPALLLLILPTNKAAASGSYCSSWNGFNGITSGGFTLGSHTYNQNETLSVSASGPFDVTGATSATGVTSFSYTFPSTGSYTIDILSNPSAVLAWTIHCGAGAASTSSGGVTTWNFTDGRLNSHDGAQTAAAYCEDGGVTVYEVADSVGHLAFKVTKAQLAAVPAKPDHNMLIKAALGVSLYRLTTGELQINAPDNYLFIWDGCAAS